MGNTEPSLEQYEVAYHEIGHAIAWHTAGIPIVEIKLRTKLFGGVDGWVTTDNSRITTSEQGRNYLVGLLAGCEVSRRWSDENNRRHRESRCSHDIALFHKLARKHPHVEGLTERELRPVARRLVRENWTKIARCAEALAHRRPVSL